jgi:hypothetical protein
MAQTKRPKRKPKPETSMPQTTLTQLSTRKRRKRIRARVSAAISIEEPLYLQALTRAASKADNNFSGYVRNLIRQDLGQVA